MKTYSIYFATNRSHIGSNRWRPTSYGTEFSEDGRENLRFGKVALRANEKEVQSHLMKQIEGMGEGDGVGLADYFTEFVSKAKIEAFKETLNKKVPDVTQPRQRFGSYRFFSDLKDVMMQSTDVVVYIHGFNVNWDEAVGSALALQEMLNSPKEQQQKIMVVLFTWPSQGKAIPYFSYISDRADARDSGKAVGRGFLKLRDFLVDLRRDAKEGATELCDQEIHVLVHSMGNFVLLHALQRLQEFSHGQPLPRLFEHIFLCSADVDDDVFEGKKPMERLNELARSISIYYNREDKALIISDTTKANPERLGSNGAARPFKLHNKMSQIDCTQVVPGGLTDAEHSYYMLGSVNQDIALSIAGEPQHSAKRPRESTGELPNVWRMKPM